MRALLLPGHYKNFQQFFATQKLQKQRATLTMSVQCHRKRKMSGGKVLVTETMSSKESDLENFKCKTIRLACRESVYFSSPPGQQSGNSKDESSKTTA